MECDSLRSDAKRSDAVRSDAVRSDAVRSGAKRSDAKRSGAKRSDAKRSDAVRSDAVKSSARQREAMQCNSVRIDALTAMISDACQDASKARMLASASIWFSICICSLCCAAPLELVVTRSELAKQHRTTHTSARASSIVAGQSVKIPFTDNLRQTRPNLQFFSLPCKLLASLQDSKPCACS
jgi:hypothetical protein